MSRNITPSIVFGNLTNSGALSQLDTVFNQLFGQVTDSSAGWSNYGTDTGTANNYVVALTPAAASYQAGFTLTFSPANTNTGASVINVNALGTKSIVAASGGALIAGQLTAGTAVTLVYDGTQFRVMGEPSGASSFSGASDTGAVNAYALAYSGVGAYQPGMLVSFTPANANTGASTLNINSLGTKPIVNQDNVALQAGALTTTRQYTLVYDGTSFRLIAPASGWAYWSITQSIPNTTITTFTGFGAPTSSNGVTVTNTTNSFSVTAENGMCLIIGTVSLTGIGSGITVVSQISATSGLAIGGGSYNISAGTAQSPAITPIVGVCGLGAAATFQVNVWHNAGSAQTTAIKLAVIALGS